MKNPDALYLRYAWNDLARNRGANLALAVILVFSAFLMATGAMVMERLVGSVDALFAQAKPPHFLQMHKGDYDESALAAFAESRPEVEAWLIEEMLGFDGSAIAWSRESSGEKGDLSESLIDNLFVTQNTEFDFLIDQAGAIAEPSVGEVYVPVAYQQRFALQQADQLSIQTEAGIHTLTVAGFVRDAQMASSMSSATRFVISESDFNELRATGSGAEEIIVEYLLSDPGLASDLQSAYESDEALPKNGQAVTYQMIRMINAISDGLMAVALIFVSLLLIAIALLNLRFVIRGALEDEVRQIGAMKAIGIPNRAISGLYLSKYSIMTLVACVVGGLMAVLVTQLLTQSIQANYAVAPVSVWTFLVPVIALVLVYVIVLAICRSVLSAIRKIEVVGALVQGSTLDEKQTAKRAKRLARQVRNSSLTNQRGADMNRKLALLDLRSEMGQWILIPIVFALAAVLMILPTNLLTTFESPNFVTYMGAPESDVRADLQFSDSVDEQRAELLSAFQSDARLDNLRVFSNKLYETEGEEGWESINVEVGDYSADTVEFLEGTAPREGQIALSVLNGRKFSLAAGDTITIRSSGTTSQLEVSGLYQDVTRGGYTAKLQGEATSGATSYTFYADTVEGVDPAQVASEYAQQYPDAAVIPMHDYVKQTLSYVTDAFRGAAILAVIFGIGVALLITSLFLKLRLTKDRQKLGVLTAIGFSTRELVSQVVLKTLMMVAIGTVIGVLLAATLGEAMVGGLISLAGLGIAKLSFLPNPLLVYLVFPLILIGAGYAGALALTAGLRGADKSSWLKGE